MKPFDLFMCIILTIMLAFSVSEYIYVRFFLFWPDKPLVTNFTKTNLGDIKL